MSFIDDKLDNIIKYSYFGGLASSLTLRKLILSYLPQISKKLVAIDDLIDPLIAVVFLSYFYKKDRKNLDKYVSFLFASRFLYEIAELFLYNYFKYKITPFSGPDFVGSFKDLTVTLITSLIFYYLSKKQI